ncbi:class I SAM-dependent methyltransferase [Mycolicibacterium thermoresistibile]
MYYGTRDEFAYFLCVECDSLQIVEALDDEQLARHYPKTYYSYTVTPPPALFQWLTTQQDQYALRTGGRPVGPVVAALPPGLRSLLGTRDASGDVVQMLGRIGIARDAAILDVGCGAGGLLDRLAGLGFSNVSGADPFLAADTVTPRGVPIAKRYLSEVPDRFDLIMFNHSLEHVADPVGTLRAAADRLAPGGVCLVRLPTTSSEAWATYGPHWCLIDAPRHIVVPSRRAMAVAAARVGLRLDQTWDDSNSSQFIGSEAYRQDIAVPEIGNFIRHFGLRRIWGWERRSRRLNRTHRGDQAGFALRAA